MSEETNVSDGLEQSLDHGIDAGLAAKGAYDTAAHMGAAAASTGQAAAESAAAAGAGGSAAAGAGAAAGTAAGGPAGTVLGAVIGLAAGIFAKPLMKGIIVIVVFLFMAFSSLPSMLFEQPVDTADNAGPMAVYQQFKDYVQSAYEQEIEKRKEEIEQDFERRINSGEFSEYDHVTYTYYFDPTEAAFLSEVREACVLIIAMFEIHTDDWREASFDHFKAAVDSVNFWNDIVLTEKLSETSTVTWSDGDEEEEPESTIHVEMTYRFHDKGVEQLAKNLACRTMKSTLKVWRWLTIPVSILGKQQSSPWVVLLVALLEPTLVAAPTTRFAMHWQDKRTVSFLVVLWECQYGIIRVSPVNLVRATMLPIRSTLVWTLPRRKGPRFMRPWTVLYC